MRLNRYLSVAGVSSRRKGETLIRDGRISVNGVTVTDPAYIVNVDADTVTFDGKPLTPVREADRQYIVLNKPTGVIVSRGDTHGRATVFDLLGEGMENVFPVGRLDADTSGVLLLTDDGDLAYRLTHPSFGVEKVYRVEVSGRVTEDDVAALAGGIELDDGPAAPAEMTIIDSGEDISLITVTMHQGRKRQVRRMLEKIGHPVRILERISFGGITAVNLPLGSYRLMTQEEVRKLKRKNPIVAIDGPVGAGKSTTARAVAERLGFLYVDTGAMYRAATLDVLEHNVDPSDEASVCRIVQTSSIELVIRSGEQRTLLNVRDVSDRIRDRDVTRAVSAVSALGCVRVRMTELQRRLGRNGGVVMEGRDIGTVVFPDAECKIYLDASVEVRAGRRHKEMIDRGIAVSYEELVEEIRERDRANTMRELAPLCKAEDAVLVDTTGMTLDEQVQAVVAIVVRHNNIRMG